MLSFNCFLIEKWDDSTIFVSLFISLCMCVFECIDFAFSWVASEMQIFFRFGFLLEKRIHELSSSSFVLYLFGLISKRIRLKTRFPLRQETGFVNDMQTFLKWGLTCFIFVTKYLSLLFGAAFWTNDKWKKCLVLFHVFQCFCYSNVKFIVIVIVEWNIVAPSNLHNALHFIRSFSVCLRSGLCCCASL